MLNNNENIEVIKSMLDCLKNGKSITYRLKSEKGTKDVVINDPKQKIKQIKGMLKELEY